MRTTPLLAGSLGAHSRVAAVEKLTSRSVAQMPGWSCSWRPSATAREALCCGWPDSHTSSAPGRRCATNEYSPVESVGRLGPPG